MYVRDYMFRAIQSLYVSVRSCVLVIDSDWFLVFSDLRQGCILPPLQFNLYLDDLVKYLKSLDVGVSIAEEKILRNMLYADDTVLIAPNENDIQILLNELCTTGVAFSTKHVSACDVASLYIDRF